MYMYISRLVKYIYGVILEYLLLFIVNKIKPTVDKEKNTSQSHNEYEKSNNHAKLNGKNAPKSSKPRSGHSGDAGGDASASKSDYVSERGLEMHWSRIRGPGVGNINVGNTCFINSVLQLLAYTPPLYNYLLNNRHKCS